MNMFVKKFALAALCTSALTFVSQSSQAAPLFDITGVAQNSFSYGTAPGADNVINFNGLTSTGSTIADPGAAPSTWLGSNISTNSFVSVTGLAANEKFTVSWTYAGSESDNVIQFTVPNTGNTLNNGAITTNEDNRNNSCTTCQPGHLVTTSTVPMGSTTYLNDGTNVPAFTLTDITPGAGGTVTNGGVNPPPAAFGASLIFSYATFDGSKYTLTNSQTGFVVFGFNDNGFGDDNHDDFVGILSVVSGGFQEPTPIPGALPLFGTVLGGGFLFRRLRKRNKTA